MTSWGDDKLEQRIDELLATSVGNGSEPEELELFIVPPRPAFPWLTIAAVLAAAAVLGVFMYQWMADCPLDSGLASVLSMESLPGFLSGVSPNVLISVAAALLGLGGVMLAFLSGRTRGLRHLL